MSEIKVNKVSPATGTAIQLGDSGDTFTVPSGATIVNSGTATGFGGGGKVAQVLSVTKSDVFTSTAGATWTDITGFSVSITPSASTSKILVMVTADISNPNSTNPARIQLLQDSTPISVGTGVGSRIAASFAHNTSATYMHTPSGAIVYLTSAVGSTSAITFKCQGRCAVAADTFVFNRNGSDGNDLYNTRTASSITVQEILA